MSSLPHLAILLGAGVIAGVLGSAGAITSLVSYPALLAVGIPPLSANVTNIVAGAALWPGSAAASRPELHGRARWVSRHVPSALVGAGIGVVLLLCTPAHRFVEIVPFLVAMGSLALLLSPVLTDRSGGHRQIPAWTLQGAILLVSIYAGYFGAASGVMILALLAVAVTPHLPTANALKNMLIGAGSLIAAVTLVLLHPVDWGATLPLAAGMLIGSLLGPRLTRRVPATVIRPLIATIGLALALALFINHGG